MNNPSRPMDPNLESSAGLALEYPEVAATNPVQPKGSMITGSIKWLFSKLPADFPEFVYTTLLRPWPFRQITNFVIQKSLPESVSYGPAVVMLNPTDPVVSGALAFRVYENSEREFLLAHCQPGMTFLDIGANIGYYTALATHAVGPQGNVIALEPDPESFRFLNQTVAANQAENVQCFRIAAAEKTGTLRLYLSDDNRGDNRIYQPEPNWTSVEVETVTVDGLMGALGFASVDFIKIDVQGAEGKVIAGMRDVIRNSRNLTIMTEFWPAGLSQCGTDPTEFLAQLERLGLVLYEMESHSEELIPVSNHAHLIRKYRGRRYGTLIAVRPDFPSAAVAVEAGPGIELLAA